MTIVNQHIMHPGWMQRRTVTHPAWRSRDESNPLVRSGEYERVFVADLRPGDVNPFGEVVESITRHGDETATVFYDNGFVDRPRLDRTRLVKVVTR